MSRMRGAMKEAFTAVLGGCLLGGCLIGINPLGYSLETVAVASQEKVATTNWQEVKSKPGKCSMSFPSNAEHVTETMKIDEDGTELKYDAYISATENDSVFMLLIAQYPDFVDDSFAQMSLEAFLNGILSQGSGSQLLFADLVLVHGHEGLDFFIKTGANYFKARVVMVKSKLYLMAMECKVSDYNESHYDRFVNSFLLNH